MRESRVYLHLTRKRFLQICSFFSRFPSLNKMQRIQQQYHTTHQRGPLPHNMQRWKGFRPYCQMGRAFDDRHFTVSGRFCRHKHRLFRWKGVRGSNATLLSDSLCKWVRQVSNTDVQSIPGLNLSRLVEKIQDYTMFVNNYRLILLNVGTNNLEEDSQEEILEKFGHVIAEIRSKNPRACIVINSIFFRPRDIPEQMQALTLKKEQEIAMKKLKFPGEHMMQAKPCNEPSTSNECKTKSTTTHPPSKKELTSHEKFKALHPMEKKRRVVNKSIRKLCQETSCLFLESWRCVQNKKTKEVNLDCFAYEGLHLNDQGIAAMTEYVDGNVQRLLPATKAPRKRKVKTRKPPYKKYHS